MKKEVRQRAERDRLMALPEFRRFLFEILQASAITSVARESQTSLLLEGKRSLGLEILGWFSEDATPYDVIALAYQAAQETVHKGARNDRSDDYPEQ